MKNLKFYILCIVVGILTGLVTVPYRILLLKSVVVRDVLFAHDVPWWRHVLVLLAMWCVGMFIYWLVKKYPLISGSGIPQAEGAICGRFPFKNAFKSMIAKFCGGVLGIGMGFSLGREGPSVQMGAYIGKLVGKWFNAGIAIKKYLITGGAGAGLSSAFTAPLASTIFVIEEVEKFDSAKITVSALLGCIASAWIAQIMIPGNAYALIDTTAPDVSIPKLILIFLGFALLLGAVGKSFNVLTLKMLDFSSHTKIPPALKVLALIVVTYVMGYFFADLVAGGEKYLLDQATSTIRTGILYLGCIILLKLLFTPFCYSAGFPGGIFLPLLVLGGLTGKWYTLVLAQLGIIDVHYFGFFMVIGMSALFAAVVRSPVTGLILILEMTGKFSIFFPMIVVVGFTYFLSEAIGVKPIYDSLYARMLPPNLRHSEKRIIVPFEVGEDSYLDGKRVCDIQWPKHCELKQVIRRGEEMDLHNVRFEPNDRIEIELYSKDLEKLYRSFRSIADE